MIGCFHREPVRKARKRIRTQNYEKLLRLSKQMGRAAQIDLTRGLRTFKQKVTPEQLLDAYNRGSYGHILEVIPWDELPAAFDGMQGKSAEAINTSGYWSIRALPAQTRRGLRWDAKNPQIRRYLQKRTGKLIVSIRSETQSHVQRVTQKAFTQAYTPRDVANEIWEGIGLDPRRQKALANYKQALAEKGTPAQNAQKYAAKYEERLLKDRAMCIGRTEVRSAINFGQLSVWKDAANQGFIDKTTARKVWQVDGNPCDICEPMDGVGVPIDESWTLEDDSTVDNPTDSHPNCYCGMELDFGEGEDEG